MLPNMPDDVFNIWLKPLIEFDGWPFRRLSDVPAVRPWAQYLYGLSIKMLHELWWNRGSFIIDRVHLDPMSNTTIKALIGDHIFNVETFIRRNVSDSKERFFKLREFIGRTRTFPAPIILVRTNSHFSLEDGNHRYAALCSLNLETKIPCDSWIGTLPNT